MSVNEEQMAFDAACSELRRRLKETGNYVHQLMAHSSCFNAGIAPDGADRGEMKANIMLAYRHIEDAQMRLGKAIQAFDGGKSVYDPKDEARIAASKS